MRSSSTTITDNVFNITANIVEYVCATTEAPGVCAVPVVSEECITPKSCIVPKPLLYCNNIAEPSSHLPVPPRERSKVLLNLQYSIMAGLIILTMTVVITRLLIARCKNSNRKSVKGVAPIIITPRVTTADRKRNVLPSDDEYIKKQLLLQTEMQRLLNIMLENDIVTQEETNDLLLILIDGDDSKPVTQPEIVVVKKVRESKTLEIQQKLAAKKEQKQEKERQAEIRKAMRDIDKIYNELVLAQDVEKPAAATLPQPVVEPVKTFNPVLFRKHVDNDTADLLSSCSFIASFKYEELGRLHQLQQTLAFIFNFHCYNNLMVNLAQKKSTKISEEKYRHRGDFIHALQYVGIDDKTICQTQQMMNTFMVPELASLSPDKADYAYPGFQNLLDKLEDLTQVSRNNVVKTNIASTPLYEFSQPQGVNYKARHKAISDSVFLSWFKTTIVPTFNSLSDNLVVNINTLTIDAIKALILLCGEYCSKSRARKLQKDDQVVAEFVRKVCDLRNILAHNTRAVTQTEIIRLLEIANKISIRRADNITLDNILVPIPEVKLNPNAPEFFSRLNPDTKALIPASVPAAHELKH